MAEQENDSESSVPAVSESNWSQWGSGLEEMYRSHASLRQDERARSRSREQSQSRAGNLSRDRSLTRESLANSAMRSRANSGVPSRRSSRRSSHDKGLGESALWGFEEDDLFEQAAKTKKPVPKAFSDNFANPHFQKEKEKLHLNNIWGSWDDWDELSQSMGGLAKKKALDVFQDNSKRVEKDVRERVTQPVSLLQDLSDQKGNRMRDRLKLLAPKIGDSCNTCGTKVNEEAQAFSKEKIATTKLMQREDYPTIELVSDMLTSFTNTLKKAGVGQGTESSVNFDTIVTPSAEEILTLANRLQKVTRSSDRAEPAFSKEEVGELIERKMRERESVSAAKEHFIIEPPDPSSFSLKDTLTGANSARQTYVKTCFKGQPKFDLKTDKVDINAMLLWLREAQHDAQLTVKEFHRELLNHFEGDALNLVSSWLRSPEMTTDKLYKKMSYRFSTSISIHMARTIMNNLHEYKFDSLSDAEYKIYSLATLCSYAFKEGEKRKIQFNARATQALHELLPSHIHAILAKDIDRARFDDGELEYHDFVDLLMLHKEQLDIHFQRRGGRPVPLKAKQLQPRDIALAKHLDVPFSMAGNATSTKSEDRAFKPKIVGEIRHSSEDKGKAKGGNKAWKKKTDDKVGKVESIESAKDAGSNSKGGKSYNFNSNKNPKNNGKKFNKPKEGIGGTGGGEAGKGPESSLTQSYEPIDLEKYYNSIDELGYFD